MANSSIKPSLLFFLSFLLLLCVTTTSSLGGTKVGGRKPVSNVESNKEVQDLGKYCVKEHNRQQQQQQGNGSKLLVFSRVVYAETQVVSGIKYYLKISARGSGGSNTFEAVVVVKPWLKTNSKELVDFKPSVPNFTNTK